MAALVKTKLPRSIVCIDCDYWFYSLLNNYQIRPNWNDLFSAIREKSDISEIFVFGDFSKDTRMQDEVQSLRTHTSFIVETGHFHGMGQKNLTDPIMQSAIATCLHTLKRIQQYVLVTGDSDFIPIASMIRRSKKQLGICGVRGSLSSQLKNCSDWSFEFPSGSVSDCAIMILRNIHDATEAGRRPTYLRTVEIVSEKHSIDKALVENTLKMLLESGIVYQDSLPTVRVLKINWEMCNGEYDKRQIIELPTNGNLVSKDALPPPSLHVEENTKVPGIAQVGKRVYISDKNDLYKRNYGQITAIEGDEYTVSIEGYEVECQYNRKQFTVCRDQSAT